MIKPDLRWRAVEHFIPSDLAFKLLISITRPYRQFESADLLHERHQIQRDEFLHAPGMTRFPADAITKHRFPLDYCCRPPSALHGDSQRRTGDTASDNGDIYLLYALPGVQCH